MKTALLMSGTAATGVAIAGKLRARGFDITIYHRGTPEVDALADLEHIHGAPHNEASIAQDLGKRQCHVTIATHRRIRYLAKALRGRTGQFVSISGMPVVGMVPGVPTLESHPTETVKQGPIGLKGLLPRIIETERELLAAHTRGDFAATVVRYPYVYGPHSVVPMEWHVIKRILDKRRDWILQGDGVALGGRCASPNAARLVGLVVDRPLTAGGEIYHAADSRQHSQREWIEMVAAAMGYRFRFVDIPPAISPLGWSATPKADEYTRKRSADVAAGRLCHQLVSNEKARIELGYADAVEPALWIVNTVAHWLTFSPSVDGKDGRLGPSDFNYGAENRLLAYWERMCSDAPRLGEPLVRSHPYDHPPQKAPLRVVA